MKKPNVFLELPHGGNLVPHEVAPYIDKSFTIAHLRKDADEFSDEIFLGLPTPHQLLRSEYWRAFVDMNRSISNRGPDGVVKTNTSQGVQIYKSQDGLPTGVGDTIIERYVVPYRKKLLTTLNSSEVTQLIMCHTMPGMGTPNSLADDPGSYRPLFSLINEGDLEGNTDKNHPFASGKRIKAVGEIIRKHVREMDTEFQYSDPLTYNFPYDHFSHAREFDLSHYGGKNAFSLEVNRDLFHHNLANIVIVRNMMVEIIEMLSEFSE